MKILSNTFLILLIGMKVFSQKNEIKIDCFSPIMTSSMKQYFTDEWILFPSNNYSRKYTSIAFSASYSRQFGNYKFGYRVGIASRKIEELNDYNYFSGGNYFVSEKFNYNQTHIINSLIVSREESFQKLLFKFGFEIPFIYYGKGYNNYYNRTYSDYPTDYVITDHQKIASGYATGLGVSIAAGLTFKSRIKIGLEISEYLLFTKFTKSTIGYHSEKDIIGNTGSTNTEGEYISKNNYQQFGFSRIIPGIFFIYGF